MIQQSAVTVQHVYIRPDGRRWVWAIHVPHDCDRTSAQTFATEFEASLTASKIAQAKRLPLHVNATLRSRLIDHYRREGWRKHEAMQPRDLCANQHERRGWDAARAAMLDALLDEVYGKPGLTDYAPVAAEMEAVA